MGYLKGTTWSAGYYESRVPGPLGTSNMTWGNGFPRLGPQGPAL